jgi:hypothetical protein
MNKRYQTIRQVRITGTRDELQEISDYLFRNGYRVVRAGPKMLPNHKVDGDRFLWIGEKIVKEGE